MKNDISDQGALIRNLGIDLQDARHRLGRAQREISRDSREKSALKKEIEDNKKRDDQNRKGFQEGIRQQGNNWKSRMDIFKENTQKMNSLIETAKKSGIPVPERANPDATTFKDLSTMELGDLFDEYVRLRTEQRLLEAEVVEISGPILEQMPFMLKRLDYEEASVKNCEQLTRLCEAILVHTSDELQFAESYAELLENQEKLSELQKGLVKLQERLQAKKTSAAALDGEIEALNTQLKKGNAALETMKKGQEGIKKSIDLIRNSVRD